MKRNSFSTGKRKRRRYSSWSKETKLESGDEKSGYMVCAEIFGKGYEMWIRNQGEYIKHRIKRGTGEVNGKEIRY